MGKALTIEEYRKVTESEDALQSSCMRWLRTGPLKALYEYATHNENEGKRSRWGQMRMKSMGVSKGFPDLFLYVPRGKYHGLAIEFKRYYIDNKGELAKTYQSPDQRQWQARLEKMGYKYAVTRTKEEFIAELFKYEQL